MIVLGSFIHDFILHFIIILVLLYSVFYIKKMNFVYIALIVSLLVTYINHTYYPNFKLAEVLEFIAT